ncbi:M20/M25/M40 family metallo-hydrolase [Nocardia sp. NPDC058640]|uniref:M20/M25/M40 family metallo-hydrolase n=1 Tax=Nocardia sp. NPDC058640 TaxID=3346571 RepID=UPI0036490D32
MTEGTIDLDGAVQRLSTLLQIPTVTTQDANDTDWTQFTLFRETLETLYPVMTAKLRRQIFADHTLVYHWDTGSSADPIVLMAHQDVVAPGDPANWTFPAFSGEVADGVIWGRGAIDDKGPLVCICEAVEILLAQGFTPDRDVYLLFGHDEEVAGIGVPTVVEYFRAHNIVPGLVIDEGGGVAGDLFPIPEKVAVIGTAEKGLLDLQLTAVDPGGHASMPGKNPATTRIARALVKMGDYNFPAQITPPIMEMLTIIGEHSTGPLAAVLSRADRFQRLIAALMPRSGPLMNAMIRTTAVPTMLEGSQGTNIMAESASAVLNIRILTGETVAGTVERIRKVIDDPHVELTIINASEPTPAARTDGPAFDRVKDAVAETFPGAVISPFLVVGASDARHLAQISDYVYRFYPFELDEQARGLLHSVNERLSVASLEHGIRFYEAVLRRSH